MTDSTEITTDDDFSTTTDATTTDYTNPINTFKDSLASDIKLDDLTKIQFQWYDYLFFFMLLALSVLIGLYYAFFSRHKQNNTKEYILGGKTLKVVPVAISLISSHVSGTTILGLPSETYEHGTQYIVFLLAAFLLAISLIYIYIPLFFELQLTSSFQYLERRFDRHVRLLGSFIYVMMNSLFIPVVIYIPSLAFNQVTGYNVYVVSFVVGVTCVFYTTIGGLRAVVWSDFLQFLVTMGGMFSVMYLGTVAVGGISNVFESAERGGRLIVFNMDPNPFKRNTFWSIGFGMTVTWISGLGVSQGCIQRFLSVPDLKKARQSVWIFVAGMIITKLSALYLGLLVYAKYENCDPVKSGLVKKVDQIIPLYVLDIGRSVNGLCGLFIAGIFAAGLSAMSASLNTLSGTIYEDFLRPHLPKTTEEQASLHMKKIVVILGTIFTCSVYFIEKFGSVFQAAISLSGVITGCQLAIFTLGMTCRKVNTKGILTGAISSILLVATILIGANYHNVANKSDLPNSIEKCEYIFKKLNDSMSTTTAAALPFTDSGEIFWLFRISFYYYAVIGFLTVIIVSYPVSLLTGGFDNELDESLLTPLFRSKRYKAQMKNDGVPYKGVNEAMTELVRHNDVETKVE